jgi:hypothetical protein
MSHGSDQSEDYWPGYVDALTSMVQVLAFVMMLLAMAVFVLSQSVSKGAVEQIAKAAKVEVPADATVAELTAKVLEQISKSAAENRKPDSPASEPAAPKASAAGEPTAAQLKSLSPSKSTAALQAGKPDELPADARHLRVTFPERAYRMDAANTEAVAGFVEAGGLSAGKTRLVIRAYASDSDGAVSEARRIAYYRSMVARKALIDRKVPAQMIEIMILDTPDKAQATAIDILTQGAGAP